MVYSNTAVYGGNENGKSGHLYIFTSLKQLIMFLERSFFFRASFYTLSQTLIASRVNIVKQCP